MLTGCSGGGKSTLLQSLSAKGFATVEEPGRRIVADEIAKGGTALPWLDMGAFARRAVEMAQSDLQRATEHEGLVFFDRGIFDAAVALEHSGGPSIRETLGAARAYAGRVFVVPPWEEIFGQDAERRHHFNAAVQEYHRITDALDALGYDGRVLPRVSVRDRVEMVLQGCTGRSARSP
ncbi:AAA family ATPase [Dinoroseobacter shibae]|uniref:AAA family ATPase n=1 Tax=Dinoroseobacter shibae TaxID=215813 RepID=UPI0030EF50F5